MPTGPKGEKPSADGIANAVLVERVVSHDAEERFVIHGKNGAAKRGLGY